MQNSHIIGGEFDINININGNQDTLNSNDAFDGNYKYSSGRSALYYILLDVHKRYGISTVYLPDYFCSSILVACKKSQTKIVFYNLNDKLEIDVEKFSMNNNEKSAILLINYFGLKNLNPQIEFVRSISNKAIIIEDDVQAFYEFRKSELSADYKFTSLRKTFACPDGGLVKTAHKLQPATKTNKFYQFKLAGSILKFLHKSEYYDDDVYLHLFEKGEDHINDDIATGMSLISQEIITKTDFEKIANIRLRNTRHILNGINALGIKTILPIPEDKTPLFVPIWLENRNIVRKQMFHKQIYCPVHWPLEGMNVQKGTDMAEHEMSIIIDQRYTNRDMDFILDTLERALK